MTTEAQTEQSPVYDFLSDMEQLARKHSVGIPRTEKIQELWTAIGFRLGSQRLAIDLEMVDEILTAPPMSRIPGVKPWVRGIANVRGALLPIIDLQAALGGLDIEYGPQVRILVIHQDDVFVGFMIDELLGVKHFPVHQSGAGLPTEAEWLNPWLGKQFSINGIEWRALEVDRLLSDGTLLEYAE